MLQCSNKRIKNLLYKYFEYSTVSQIKECNAINDQYRSKEEIKADLLNVLENRMCQLNIINKEYPTCTPSNKKPSGGGIGQTPDIKLDQGVFSKANVSIPKHCNSKEVNVIKTKECISAKKKQTVLISKFKRKGTIFKFPKISLVPSDPKIIDKNIEKPLNKFQLQHLNKLACMQKHSYQAIELNGKNVSFNESLKFFAQACLDASADNIYLNPLKSKIDMIMLQKKFDVLCEKQKYSLILHHLAKLTHEGQPLDFHLFQKLLINVMDREAHQCAYLMPRIITIMHNAGLPITMAIQRMREVDDYLRNKFEKYVAEYINQDVKNLRILIGSDTTTQGVQSNDGLEYLEFEYMGCNDNPEKDKLSNSNCSPSTDRSYTENMVIKAHGTLVHLGMKSYKRLRSAELRNSSSSLTTVSSIDPFNTLLQFWARKGYVTQMQTLYHMIKCLGILPDLQTYANFFLCFGRHQFSPAENVSTFLVELINSLEKQTLKLNDVLTTEQYSGEDVETIIKAIRIVKPEFEAIKPSITYRYDLPILQNLNKQTKSALGEKMMPFHGLFDKTKLREKFERQFEMEASGIVPVSNIFNPINGTTQTPISIKKTRGSAKLKAQKEKWENELRVVFSQNVKSLKVEWEERGSKKGYSHFNLYPFMRLLPKQDYIDLLMQEVEFLATGTQFYSPSSLFLYKQLGLKINQKYIIRQKLANGAKNKLGTIYDSYLDYFINGDALLKHIPRTSWSESCLRTLGWSLQLEFQNLNWPSTYHIGIGKLLYNMILQNLSVEINEKDSDKKQTAPAFFSIYKQYTGSEKEEFRPHPTVIKMYKSDGYNQKLAFEPHMLPMLVPPVPWTSVKNGGYLLCNSSLVRLYEPFGYHNQVLNKASTRQLYPVLDALTYLGVCPWIINKPVLDVIIQIFNSNGNEKLGIPSYQSPQEYANSEQLLSPITPNAAALLHRINNSSDVGLRAPRRGAGGNTINPKTQSDMYSLWCDVLYKLSIANHFRDEIFWFPHNMDFRSRVYPIPPYFNHLNADSIRSFMLFARGQPLGADGLRWLKLHLVNLLGTHKRFSIPDRLNYIESVMPTVLECAKTPLKEGCEWWMQADDPWQALACCMEIANATSSPDPAQYVSHFPIHQDGSCNGLQHYAALGRDAEGGDQVNLMPSEKPNDVYTAVAEKVEELRKQDAIMGDDTAIFLENKITRKVVKQTVMTVVYGVTRYGAKEQITRQLEAQTNFPKSQLKPCSIYLVEKTFESIKKLFNATREIQDWFTECARMVCSYTNLTLEWITPMGFPVAQPYSKRTALVLPRGLQGDSTSILQLRSGIFEKPMTAKQKNAFPPNFIHSLDSTHMMLTALSCQKHLIHFVAVHDCFWTHACHVKTMNEECRKQFVLLHEQPILEELSNYFVQHYSYTQDEINAAKDVIKKDMLLLNATLARVPTKGTLDIKKVLESTFFFS